MMNYSGIAWWGLIILFFLIPVALDFEDFIASIPHWPIFQPETIGGLIISGIAVTWWYWAENRKR